MDLLDVFQQFCGWYPETSREAGHHADARIAARELKAPDLGGVHADALSKGFLREPFFSRAARRFAPKCGSGSASVMVLVGSTPDRSIPGPMSPMWHSRLVEGRAGQRRRAEGRRERRRGRWAEAAGVEWLGREWAGRAELGERRAERRRGGGGRRWRGSRRWARRGDRVRTIRAIS